MRICVCMCVCVMTSFPPQIFHFCTAKQTGDTITFSAVCFGPKFSMTAEEKYWLSNASVAPGRVYNFELNLATNECVRSDRPVDPASVEFPTVHPYRHGLPNSRFSYLMASDRPGKNLPYRDVVKVTLIKESCDYDQLLTVNFDKRYVVFKMNTRVKLLSTT